MFFPSRHFCYTNVEAIVQKLINFDIIFVCAMNHSENLSRERIEKLSLTKLIDIMKKCGLAPQKTQSRCVDALLSYAERETRHEKR